MLNWINKKRNKKGFTLVELVVVIAILGILAAVAVPKLTASQDKAKWSAHAANIRTIEGAISMYEADGGDITKVTVSNVGAETLVDDSGATAFKDVYLTSWPNKPGTYTITSGVLSASPSIDDTNTNVNLASPAKFTTP